jgi:hypothetical protein
LLHDVVTPAHQIDVMLDELSAPCLLGDVDVVMERRLRRASAVTTSPSASVLFLSTQQFAVLVVSCRSPTHRSGNGDDV